ncbi:endonuclease domain-containing protein [Mesorhizobium marinum]|uniref:endonuclease domain-containing protein n=1 Tax=Mesorhizobium marinum TaxID=3228790 RepID=UPI003465968E
MRFLPSFCFSRSLRLRATSPRSDPPPFTGEGDHAQHGGGGEGQAMRAERRTFDRAKALRRDLSLPEVILWECLRGRRLGGLRFRRQHPVGPYVLDFYCAEARLAVEVDGAHHDFPEQMSHDRRRDGWLDTQGIGVIRIAATDILDEKALDGMLVMIAEAAGAEREGG